ncbi:MAG: hypothetical protein WA982_00800 [Rubrobacteraceae bacterium]
MCILNELDLIRQRNRELRWEAENNHLARRLRLAEARRASSHSLLTRLRAVLRPTPKEVGVGDCEG